jgi:NADH-quinone oxidoreductase subunit J
MENLFFYFFSFFTLVSALMVIAVRNPVHSVLFLMLVFCNASGILILLGSDFLAFIFLMVYVGAIAVLFLFVIMMLNIKMIEWNEFLFRYLPIGGLLWATLILETYWLLKKDFVSGPVLHSPVFVNWPSLLDSITSIEVIGNLTFTVFSFPFIISSLVLLIAMVGAIVLTMYSRSNLKRQSILEQTKRLSVDALRYVK